MAVDRPSRGKKSTT
jgi:hypothetical protein